MIGNIFLQYLEKNAVINTGKELFDITFENPTGSGVVTAHLVDELSKTIDGFVHSFVVAAGERVGDERFVEKRIENAVDGVVQETVTDSGFVDMATFGVGDVEAVIGGVLVGVVNEVSMKCQDVIHKISVKKLDVWFGSFADDKLFPGEQKVF